MVTDAELIRDRGGIRPVARKLGHRNHTTVQGWLERNRIPDGVRPAVEALVPESTVGKPTPTQSADAAA